MANRWRHGEDLDPVHEQEALFRELLDLAERYERRELSDGKFVELEFNLVHRIEALQSDADHRRFAGPSSGARLTA